MLIGTAETFVLPTGRAAGCGTDADASERAVCAVLVEPAACDFAADLLIVSFHQGDLLSF